MENNICGKMYEAVSAMCSFWEDKDKNSLIKVIGEVKRFLPTFANLLNTSNVLGDEDEASLRKLREWIGNFEETSMSMQLRKDKPYLESKESKDYQSLLSMVKETINNYFEPPIFEPQQINQTYKLLLENRNAIAEVMGVSSDVFASKLEKWLRQGEAKVMRSYSDDLLELFHNNTNLIESLIGLSDDEIAKQIKLWKRQKDKLGKPLIENPDNALKSRFAKELKANGLIKQSEIAFRIKL